LVLHHNDFNPTQADVKDSTIVPNIECRRGQFDLSDVGD
jgi:hypothetical protein